MIVCVASGQWWETAPHRALANNSVSYSEKPDIETFMREWTALVESKSGERGIFNREASKNKLRNMADVIRTMTLELTLAARSYLDRISSAILQRLSLGQQILMVLNVKSKWQRFLALFNLPTPDFHTYVKSAKKHRRRKTLGVSLTGIMDNPLMTAVI